MPKISYDELDLNADILLDLPLREGIGTLLHDVSKGHRNVTTSGGPVWTLAGSVMMLQMDGTGDYLVATNANTTDLGFTTGDYSLGCWINWTDTSTSEIVMGRYDLNGGGWELYLFDNGLTQSLNLRHHHSLTEVGTGAHPTHHRSAGYSVGWTDNSGWHLIGVSKVGGGELKMYRDGVSLTVITGTGGITDPEATTSDLLIGVRYDLGSNHYQGGMYRPRIWSRVLTASEWLGLYNKEVGLLS